MRLTKKISKFYQKIKENALTIGAGAAILVGSMLPGCDESQASPRAPRTEIDNPTSLEQIANEDELNQTSSTGLKAMPVLNAILDITVNEGEAFAIPIIATGTGALNYTFSGPFTFTLIDPLQNMYAAQTDLNSSGNYIIRVTATDSEGSTFQDVNLTVHELQKILYQKDDDIFIMYPNNAGKTQLTFCKGQNKDAVFSSDGLLITFVSNRTGQDDVYLMLPRDLVDRDPIWMQNIQPQFLGDGQGDNLAQLTNDINAESKPRFNPAKTAVFYLKDLMGNTEIHCKDLAGIETRLTFSGAQSITDFDSSANYLVFVQAGNIYRSDHTGANTTQLTFDGTIATPYSKLKISPDETKIAASKLNGLNDRDINILNIDGTGQIEISNNPDNDDNPAWSRDSAKIAYESNGNITASNADGTGKTQYTTSGNNTKPVFGPGNEVAFSSKRYDGISDNLYKLRLSDGTTTKLTKDHIDHEARDWK